MKTHSKQWEEMYAEAGVVDCLAADLIVISSRPFQKKFDYVAEDQLFYSSQTKYVGAYSKTSLTRESKYGYRFWMNQKSFQRFCKRARGYLKRNEKMFHENHLLLRSKKLKLSDLSEIYQKISRSLLETTGLYLLTQPERQQGLEQELKIILSEKSKHDDNGFFQKLTQPNDLTSVQRERRDFLEFFFNTFTHIQERNRKVDEVIKSDTRLNDNFEMLVKQYSHISIGGFSKDWHTISYYFRFFREVKKDRKKFVQELKHLLNYQETLSQEKKEVIKQSRVSKKGVLIAERLSRVGYLRQELHYSYDHVHYLINEVVERAAPFLKKTTKELFAYRHAELAKLLKDPKLQLDDREITDRTASYLFFVESNRLRFFTSKDANTRLNALLPLVDHSHVREFVGQTAFRGVVQGKARVFSYAADTPELRKKMKEMVKGEILVSSQTAPYMMPVIIQAAAIITDEGGITAHAAIVSRELKKPCIVGTKIATKVLKDGDLVEVDADKGVVKILKQAGK